MIFWFSFCFSENLKVCSRAAVSFRGLTFDFFFQFSSIPLLKGLELLVSNEGFNFQIFKRIKNFTYCFSFLKLGQFYRKVSITNCSRNSKSFNGRSKVIYFCI